MKGFTNDKNLDMIIMNKLNDYELGRVCQTNSYAKSICDSEIFWLNRYITKYGKFLGTPEEIKEKGGFNTWKQYYTSTKNVLEKGTYKNVLMSNRKIVKRYFIQEPTLGAEILGLAHLVRTGETIEDPNQLVLLNLRFENNESLGKYAQKGDLSQVRKIVDEIDSTLIDYSMGYQTDNYDIFKMFYDMKIPYNKHCYYVKNYDIYRDLLRDGVIDPNLYSHDPKVIKLGIEYDRVDQKGMKRALKHLMKRIDSLDDMKEIYLMMIKRIEQ